MFSMSIRPEILKNIREKYPPGTTVEVVEFHDQYFTQMMYIVFF